MNSEQLAGVGGQLQGDCARKPPVNTAFDDLNANLEEKIDRLLRLQRNLMGKNDRLTGPLPAEVSNVKETPEPGSAMERTHMTLMRMEAVISGIDNEIRRLDAIAGE